MSATPSRAECGVASADSATPFDSRTIDETLLALRVNSRTVYESLNPEVIGQGSFRVNYWESEQLDVFLPYLVPTGIMLLDQTYDPNGLLSLERENFWSWANEVQADCPLAVAVIPNMANREQDNWLEAAYALRTPLTNFSERTMFVWYLSDSDEKLSRAARLFNFLAICTDEKLNPRTAPEHCLKRLRTANGIINRMERRRCRRPFLHLGGMLGVLREILSYDSADAPQSPQEWPVEEREKFVALARRRLKNRRRGRKRATTNFNS